jgi:hypothetical protein
LKSYKIGLKLYQTIAWSIGNGSPTVCAVANNGVRDSVKVTVKRKDVA